MTSFVIHTSREALLDETGQSDVRVSADGTAATFALRGGMSPGSVVGNVRTQLPSPNELKDLVDSFEPERAFLVSLRDVGQGLTLSDEDVSYSLAIPERGAWARLLVMAKDDNESTTISVLGWPAGGPEPAAEVWNPSMTPHQASSAVLRSFYALPASRGQIYITQQSALVFDPPTDARRLIRAGANSPEPNGLACSTGPEMKLANWNGLCIMTNKKKVGLTVVVGEQMPPDLLGGGTAQSIDRVEFVFTPIGTGDSQIFNGMGDRVGAPFALPLETSFMRLTGYNRGSARQHPSAEEESYLLEVLPYVGQIPAPPRIESGFAKDMMAAQAVMAAGQTMFVPPAP